MGKFTDIIIKRASIQKESNKKKIEANLKKGMSPEKAVKNAYPKISKKDLKRVVRLVKKQTINQGPNSSFNVYVASNNPRTAVQDNRGRGDFQDSHSRKWAHGVYEEKTAQAVEEFEASKEGSYFIKEANIKEIEKNVAKGMNPVQAVKKAYPKWSDKKVAQFIKDVQAVQKFKAEGGKGKPKFGKYAEKLQQAKERALSKIANHEINDGSFIHSYKKAMVNGYSDFVWEGREYLTKEASDMENDVARVMSPTDGIEKVSWRKWKRLWNRIWGESDEVVEQTKKQNKKNKNKKNTNTKPKNDAPKNDAPETKVDKVDKVDDTPITTSGTSTDADNFLSRYWNNTGKIRKATDLATIGLLAKAGYDLTTNPAVVGTGDRNLPTVKDQHGNEIEDLVTHKDYQYDPNFDYDPVIKNWNDQWRGTEGVDSVSTSWGNKEKVLLIPLKLQDTLNLNQPKNK